MVRTSNIQCTVCKKWFQAKRCDAKTCGGACRQQRSIAKRGGEVKSDIGLREDYYNSLLEIRANKPFAAQHIDSIIANWGSAAGEWAITACLLMVQ